MITKEKNSCIDDFHDIFNYEPPKENSLSEEFIEPPFSVLDARKGAWKERKRRWMMLGISSEIGRDSTVINMDVKKKDKNIESYVSIFDPALCEVIYKWFCPNKGKILDPFAGGSVRGVVANFLNYKYTGLDIRAEQIVSNRVQARNILDEDNQPDWRIGDSRQLLDSMDKDFDFIFSCPPYADLEKYSDLKGDISNMDYTSFLVNYKDIIRKCYDRLKKGAYACFVVGEVRDKKGNYLGFVPDTVKCFMESGFVFYNEGILLTMIGSASMRARGNMKKKKLAKVHQNVLLFKKE